MNALRLVSTASLVVLAGCAVGPDYQRPALDTPAEFRLPAAPTNTVDTARSFGELGWWEVYEDPQLVSYEEEPEMRDYPTEPKFRQMFGPRGVLRLKATDKDDPTVDPRFGKIGKQIIEDTGPLTKKRMETIDDETSAAAIDFIKRQAKAGKPFFVWYNSTRMHFRTHVREEHRSPKGATALTEYADGMIEHDGTVGSLLKTLDDLGITDNTIVIYTTDEWPARQFLA